MHLNNIKNLDPIYSSEFGKGTIVSVTWRKSNQLLMCYFSKIREHIWITSDEIIGNNTFSLTPFEIKEEDLKKNVRKKGVRSFSFDGF